MNRPKSMLVVALSVAVFCQASALVHSASVEFVGSHMDIGGTYYPGGSLPYVTVPWRSNSDNNIYAVDSNSPNQYYGRDGYALFCTNFSYPDADAIPGVSGIDPVEGHEDFQNIIDLPTWVSDSAIVAEYMAGGWAYALIDDPVLQHGTRYWSFDGVNYPAYGDPEWTDTGQNPYVQLGVLNGSDFLGHDPLVEPTGRWGFTVGPDAPYAFRIGVMSGGTDNSNYAPIEVFLQQYDGLTPVGTPLGTGELARNRFVDMHFFDIVGAQEGDQFVVGVMAGDYSQGKAPISGISFDVLPDPEGDADFDVDGDVDVADVMIWQRGFGLTGQVNNYNGDANGDGVVDEDDLVIWKLQLGTVPASVSEAFVTPEPSTVILSGICGLAWLGMRRRNSRQTRCRVALDPSRSC